MAYSDYGGYAYRNGKRVVERSDATINPNGDIFGSPGMWPGFAAILSGGKEEYEKRIEYPYGHVVLGDGPIYVVMKKQSIINIYYGQEKLDICALINSDHVPHIESYDRDGETIKYLNIEHFVKNEEMCSFEADGWKLDVYFLEEDNFYQYARLTQPNGNVWHGWSGYGVGAGLEDAGYGFSTKEREDMLWQLFEKPIEIKE